MDEIDRMGHRAADVLVADVQRRIDVEDALQRLHTDRVTTLVAVEQPADAGDRARPSSRRMVQWMSAAAAVAALVAGGVVLAGRDDNAPTAPVGSVEATTAPTAPDTPLPTSTPTATTIPPASTVPPTPGVQQAMVTIDDSTPTLEGAVVGSLATGNPGPYGAAVTPSGKVFVGQLVQGAPFAELVGGRPFSTPIEGAGGLRAGLDERLHALDPLNGQIVTWVQTDGQWSVDRTDPLADGCVFEVQPTGVRCGDVEIPSAPAAEASTVEWIDATSVSVGNATESTTWQISIDSADLPDDCVAVSCQSYARYGTSGLAWTPGITDPADPDTQLVSLLTPDAAPTTAWLECGQNCQIIGADANSIYTLGDDAGGGEPPGVVVRRFAFANIAAASSTPDPTLIDALAGFPEPAAETPDLAAVPLMLPTVEAPDATTAIRSEYADQQATRVDYDQVWYGQGENAPTLSISTHLDQGPGLDGDPVLLDPWDRAFFTLMADGYTQLVLHDPSGMVTMWSQGLTRDDLLTIARSMRLRTDDRPGWQVDDLPSGFISAYDDWVQGAAMRSVRWTGPRGTQMEMWVSTGINAFSSLWTENSNISVDQIEGATVITFEIVGRTALIWSPQPGVTVLIGIYGSVDEAMAVARSVVLVDVATWEAASTVQSPDEDGCNSMFC